jgi:CRP/FNR family cyclic AMP-dependent transcriptional regulator
LTGLGPALLCTGRFKAKSWSPFLTKVATLLLRHVPLFSRMPEDQLAQLAQATRRKNYSRDESIVTEGDTTDSLYVVVSGTVKVVIGDKRGRKIILAILGPGEYFGEMAPIEERPRSASVIAMESCELLMLSKVKFRKCLEDNFDMAMALLSCAFQRLREADRKIGRIALMDVYGRVAGELLEMSETIHGHHVITQKIPRQQMADTIGASREMVSRVMKDLLANGVIEVRGGTTYLRENGK